MPNELNGTLPNFQGSSEDNEDLVEVQTSGNNFIPNLNIINLAIATYIFLQSWFLLKGKLKTFLDSGKTIEIVDHDLFKIQKLTGEKLNIMKFITVYVKEAIKYKIVLNKFINSYNVDEVSLVSIFDMINSTLQIGATTVTLDVRKCADVNYTGNNGETLSEETLINVIVNISVSNPLKHFRSMCDVTSLLIFFKQQHDADRNIQGVSNA